MPKAVSVEYAHIYTNGQIGQEHQIAIKLLSGVKQKLDNTGESYNLVVLVDDYSFPDPTFDYGFYSAWLATKGFKPGYLYRESQLIPLCDEVLGLIEDESLKLRLVNYIKSKKYPCSLFIAAWYLLRLAAISHQAFAEGIQAKRLINILP